MLNLSPGQLNLTVYRSADWYLEVIVYDDDAGTVVHDVTGCTSKFRLVNLATGAELDNFTVTVGGVDGKLTIQRTPTQKDAWPIVSHYELLLTDSSPFTAVILTGKLKVK